VRALARPVLQHRIGLTHRARLDGLRSADVVEQVLAVVPHLERALPTTLTSVGA